MVFEVFEKEQMFIDEWCDTCFTRFKNKLYESESSSIRLMEKDPTSARMLQVLQAIETEKGTVTCQFFRPKMKGAMVAKKRKNDRLKITRSVASEGQWKQQTEESEPVEEPEEEVKIPPKKKTSAEAVPEDDDLHMAEQTRKNEKKEPNVFTLLTEQQQQHRVQLKEQQSQQQLFLNSFAAQQQKAQDQILEQQRLLHQLLQQRRVPENDTRDRINNRPRQSRQVGGPWFTRFSV